MTEDLKMYDEFEDQELPLKKSRTQLKNEMKQLQKMGEELVSLPGGQLKKLDLPESLIEAIEFARTTKKHEARRRQMQRIGALMREIDPEPIQQMLDDIANGRKAEARHFQELEKWRDELIAGNSEILETIFDQFPAADRQHINQLVRNAQKEAKENKPPKSARALFKHLRELKES